MNAAAPERVKHGPMRWKAPASDEHTELAGHRLGALATAPPGGAR
jgi:hypothetical protein